VYRVSSIGTDELRPNTYRELDNSEPIEQDCRTRMMRSRGLLHSGRWSGSRTIVGIAAVILAGGVVAATRANWGTQTAGSSFGSLAGMHVSVLGSKQNGYRAKVYDGTTFVTGRGMVGRWDVTVLPGTSSYYPTGPTLLTAGPGESPEWQRQVRGRSQRANSVSLVNATAPDGQSGVNWSEARATSGSSIVTQPDRLLTPNDHYQIQVTVQGSGDVRLEFYNGESNLAGSPVQLSSTPRTLTLDVVPPLASADARIELSTTSSGHLDLWATSSTLRLSQLRGVTAQDRLENRYRKFSYDERTKTLTLSGASNTVEGVEVSRYETYRFVSRDVIAARIGVSVNRPAVLWFSPYTDFNSSWAPLWVGGYSSHYQSPALGPRHALSGSPVPIIGVSDGNLTYGVASDATWDDPVPGYDTPHLVIDKNRLAAPLIGTETNPVTLTAGRSESWGQVLFRGGRGTYGLALGGEMAMGAALGFNQHNSPGAGPGAGSEFGVISRVTAYWDRETTTDGTKSLVPSAFYSPWTYMRDSFWTALALAGTPFGVPTEADVVRAFAAAVPTTGDDAGHVPVTDAGGYYQDESGLYYLIRLEHDVGQLRLHLAPSVRSGAARVLAYIEDHQVEKGAFLTAAPANYGNGYVISPDSWLDGYLYPPGAIDTYDQGLYVVALEAAQLLDLDVTQAQVDQADAVYRSLYKPQREYLVWMSTTTYKSPDVLVGDALSLYLFNRPLLPASEVVSTLRAQATTPYGTKDVATSDNGYLSADQFRTLQTNGKGVVEGVGEPAGWYQNGGSWFLWTYLAEYAALRTGYKPAAADIATTVREQLEVTPMSKEFQLTAQSPGTGSVDGAYPYDLGSSGVARQGYGWNTAFATLQASLAKAPEPLAPLGSGPPN
jgi:hypothetical protein